MAKLSDHHVSNTLKMLFIGDSGAGKTGALASLASAGYNLRILDLDNGLDVLTNLLTGPNSPYAKDAISRVSYVTVTEKMATRNGTVRASAATVWPRVTNLLADWADGDEKFGPVVTWTPNEVLVIDSLTLLSTSCLNYVLSLNGRLGQHPQLQDWGAAQNLMESLLQMLYSTEVKCNVIINCHITYIGDEGGITRAYPAALGRALPPKIGRYFNTMLLASSRGSGNNIKRQIHTNTVGFLDLKNTAPLSVKSEYPLATGLAEYFYALHGKHKPI